MDQLRGGGTQQGQSPQGQFPQGQAQSGSQGDAQAQSTSSSEANAAAEAAAHHDDDISPLEWVKRDSLERDETGGNTSASDFLRGGN